MPTTPARSSSARSATTRPTISVSACGMASKSAGETGKISPWSSRRRRHSGAASYRGIPRSSPQLTQMGACSSRGTSGRPWELLRTCARSSSGSETKYVSPKLVLPATRHTVEHDRRDVQAHYDLSDEFFRLFLDEKMVYSCAYFASPDQSLDRAQERKLDLICKKLGLRPGDSFLDVGCGWGALLIWAARHYGVWAHGITLSDNQAAEA